MAKLCMFNNGVCEESGEYREEVCDARGIFVSFICSKCRSEKLSSYRPEIFTNSQYWHDEPID